MLLISSSATGLGKLRHFWWVPALQTRWLNTNAGLAPQKALEKVMQCAWVCVLLIPSSWSLRPRPDINSALFIVQQWFF